MRLFRAGFVPAIRSGDLVQLPSKQGGRVVAVDRHDPFVLVEPGRVASLLTPEVVLIEPAGPVSMLYNPFRSSD